VTWQFGTHKITTDENGVYQEESRSWSYNFSMPLSAEFKRHLHDVMVEVAESLSDSQAKYKAELIGKARTTHNGGATPIAYKDAALHALRTRFEKTVERYFQALSEWGIRMGDDEEREMLTHIYALTSGPNKLHFPPGLRLPNESAYQGDYARSRERLVHELQLSAKNKLREIKMRGLLEAQDNLRGAQSRQELQPSIVNHHYTVTGPNARVNVGSTDNSSNVLGADKAAPSSSSSKRQGLSFSDGLAIVLFCLSGVMALVLVWLEKTPVWGGVTVGSMALLIVYPVLHVCRTRVQRTLALVAVWALIAFFGWKIWPHSSPREGVYTLAPGAILVPGKYPHNENVEPKPKQKSTVTPDKQERGGELGQSATVADGVRALLREELQVDESKIKPQSDLILDLGATPLDVSEIVMGLETSYDIKIKSSEARNLKSVQDLIDCVEKKTAGTPTPRRRLLHPIQ
jgi:acyl carrier protein